MSITPQTVSQLLVTTDLKAFVTLQDNSSQMLINHFSTVKEMSAFLSNPSFNCKYTIINLIYVPMIDEDESLTFKTYSKNTFLQEFPYEPQSF